MNILSTLKSVFFAAVLTAFFSCTEKKSVTNTIVPDIISMTSPLEGASFNNGDTVKFIGTILTEEQIHGYNLNFLRKNTTDTLFSYTSHEHNNTVYINSHWVNNVSTLTDAELVIIVHLTHENTFTKKIQCQCKP